MSLARIKKGDTVQVMNGREKNKTGKVLSFLDAKGRVLIEGINKMKRHTKPSKQNQQGGIIEKEAPVAIANVLPYCPKCKKGVRVASKITKDKKEEMKIRVCVQCEESLDVKS